MSIKLWASGSLTLENRTQKSKHKIASTSTVVQWAKSFSAKSRCHVSISTQIKKLAAAYGVFLVMGQWACGAPDFIPIRSD